MQWCIGPFRVDLANACLWRGDERLVLRPKTFALLVYLLEHAGDLVTKDALLAAVWPEAVVAESALTVSMSELRKVLGETARTPQFIATIHRRGYRFIAPVVAEDAALPAVSTTAAGTPITRRLAVILSADVQGYSRLMEHDDEATVHTLTTYRAVMAALIAQHHGRVIDAPGDNLLAEFASTVAAVECAVAMQAALAQRNQALPAARQMWFRMGITLGDVLAEGDQLYGDGVNLAARLEGLAEGGGICISGTVYDHIETKLPLAYTDLGEHVVKNMARPVRVYRVEPLSASASSLERRDPLPAWHPAASRALRSALHLVNREAELAQLHAYFAQALQGERQVIFISGEAGIGKTTLVDAFVAQLAGSPVPWIGHGQCIEHYGAGEPYLPLLEAFGQLCRGPDGAHLIARLTQQAPSWLLQMPALLSAEAYDTLQRRVAGATRERMLRELAEAVEALSVERPLVLVLEDLHWSDTSTVEWLAYVARRHEAARLLVLGTYRPVDAMVRGHPLRTVTQELQVRGQCTELVLEYLSEVDVAAYLSQRFVQAPLLPGLARVLHQRTTGNPLFLVATVDALVQLGVLREGTTGWELAGGLEALTAEVPESLRQLIERQLEQLTSDEQELLETASIAGKEFAVAAVAAAVDRTVDEVEARCAALARRGQFLQACGTDAWPDGTVASRYGFRHDLYRETLYEQVPAGRRVQWHLQIGMRLEAAYHAQTREIAAELALHFVQGREALKAVRYLHAAGENALRLSAYQEALSHLRQGLDALHTLPDTSERLQHELDVRMALGPALMATKGYVDPEVATNYARARALCQQGGTSPQFFPVLWGLWQFANGTAQHQTAWELGEQLLAVAQQRHEPIPLLQAHHALWTTAFHRGELTTAQMHIEHGLQLYTPEQHHAHAVQYAVDDPGVCSLSTGAQIQWLLGYPDQAEQRSQAALALAQNLAHPYSLAHALIDTATIAQLRRDVPAVTERAEAVLALGKAYGFRIMVALGTVLRGWALALQQPAAGMAQMRQGLAALRAMGTEHYQPWFRLLLIEACSHTGRLDEGCTLLDDALRIVQTTGERVMEAELLRLKGDLLQAHGANHRAEVEAYLQQALAVARQQQAKSLELRAVMNLSRLWQHQGKHGEARELLAPVYGWFTEGFDTADLQAAKTLLEELDG